MHDHKSTWKSYICAPRSIEHRLHSLANFEIHFSYSELRGSLRLVGDKEAMKSFLEI